MSAFSEPACIAVAFSGGRDSTALLHATAVAAQAVPGLRVVAMHVHHGLSAHADAWLTHAQTVCQQWAQQGLPVQLVFRRVTLALEPGDSVEAVARAARHAALNEMAHEVGAAFLLLAHHRQDQAETLLLQALRGGGVAGLAGMPREAMRDDVLWLRPWLDHPRSAIESYVSAHDLAFIDDDSNTDPQFARNRLRLQVWPALLSAFPDAEVNLAGAAKRLSDALPVMAAWQEAAMPAVLHATPASASDGSHGEASTRAMPADLDAQAWADQPPALRRELLRHWYRQRTERPLPASWVARLADEVPRMVADQQAARWHEVSLTLYRGVLRWEPSSAAAVAETCCDDTAVSIQHVGDWPVPAWRGVLRVAAVESGGVAPASLLNLTLRRRSGGEQFQFGAGRPARALKKQYQSLGIPSWQREGPLVFCGPQLIYVPGLGIDARCVAPAGEPQWSITWCPQVVC